MDIIVIIFKEFGKKKEISVTEKNCESMFNYFLNKNNVSEVRIERRNYNGVDIF